MRALMCVRACVCVLVNSEKSSMTQSCGVPAKRAKAETEAEAAAETGAAAEAEGRSNEYKTFLLAFFPSFLLSFAFF